MIWYGWYDDMIYDMIWFDMIWNDDMNYMMIDSIWLIHMIMIRFDYWIRWLYISRIWYCVKLSYIILYFDVDDNDNNDMLCDMFMWQLSYVIWILSWGTGWDSDPDWELTSGG